MEQRCGGDLRLDGGRSTRAIQRPHYPGEALHLDWEGCSRVMKTGLTKYGRTVLAVPALTKNGRRISIEFSVVLLKEPTGEVVGIAAFLQDIIQRWERDKALQKRLAEAEALAQGR